ncbi:MAG: hypothetical protein Q9212_006863 [Teloschistes hypoglaucus]
MRVFNLVSALISLGTFAGADGPSSAYNATPPRWEWHPDPKPLANGDQGQYLNLSSGIDIWYTDFGNLESKKTPVLLLHGGMANSNLMFNQANYLAQSRRVILQE